MRLLRLKLHCSAIVGDSALPSPALPFLSFAPTSTPIVPDDALNSGTESSECIRPPPNAPVCVVNCTSNVLSCSRTQSGYPSPLTSIHESMVYDVCSDLLPDMPPDNILPVNFPFADSTSPVAEVSNTGAGNEAPPAAYGILSTTISCMPIRELD